MYDSKKLLQCFLYHQFSYIFPLSFQLSIDKDAQSLSLVVTRAVTVVENGNDVSC